MRNFYAGKYTIPPGVNFIIDLIHMQRSTEHYKANPEEFNPDNFSAENVEDRHPFSYLPFAAGSRSCIGLCSQINIVLFSLIITFFFRISICKIKFKMYNGFYSKKL